MLELMGSGYSISRLKLGATAARVIPRGGFRVAAMVITRVRIVFAFLDTRDVGVEICEDARCHGDHSDRHPRVRTGR